MLAYQICWYREWQGLHFKRSVHGLKVVYDWYLWLGFIEIRKWHHVTEEDFSSGRIQR